MADTVYVLQNVGTSPKRKTLAILGDGFAAGSDQDIYKKYVRDVVMRVFASDYFNEDAAAWNIRRINLESVDSGVSTRKWDLHGTPNDLSDDTHKDDIRDTALNIISNGQWWHHWLEYGDDTRDHIQAAIDKFAPGASFRLIIVNSPLVGGRRREDTLMVTIQEGWSTIAHEMGHGLGDLEDEYSKAGKGAYTEDGPERVNVTVNKRRKSLKWRRFVNPSTPIPTGQGKAADWTAGTKPAGWNDTADAGLFEGACDIRDGRLPAGDRLPDEQHSESSARPGSHAPQKRQKLLHRGGRTIPGPRRVRAASTSAAGVGISIWRRKPASTTASARTGQRVEQNGPWPAKIPSSWRIRPGDTYLAADFDGDGRDELVVFNSTDWTVPRLALIKVNTDGTTRVLALYDGDIPGWGSFARHDRLLVGDFDGNGKAYLLIYNFEDWAMPYAATLMSTGKGFTQSRRYDGDIPGWGGLARHDQIFVGDFGGTGHDDLLIWNSRDWSSKYLGLFRMRRNAFGCIRLWENDIPGWGGFAENDKFIVGDFNGDGKDDLYLFNGSDWANPYLAMFRSTGSDFAFVGIFDGDVPGWGGMRRNDKFLAADLTGSGKVGLFAWNMFDWSHTYAGRMVSSGTNLSADFREDWVGEWHLGSDDRFDRVPNMRRIAPAVKAPGRGPDRILVHNKYWLGSLRTTGPLHLNCIYHKWVHNYRFGRNW